VTEARSAQPRRVVLRVPAEHAEIAQARLLDLVPTGFEEEPLGNDVGLVSYGDGSLEAALRAAFPEYEITGSVVVAGWEDAWRDFHRPVVAGGTWIGPPWEPRPATGPSVVIDPGRAFGTGAHPTTRACLELLAGLERGSLLDVGCGSGVLSIAGAKLGFGPIVAIDDDPVALEVTQENATVNGVDLDIQLVDATAGELPYADVAVVNILRPAVEAVLPRLASRRVVTSGYVASDHPVASEWLHLRHVELDGWAADVFGATTSSQ
jgi:ribosomal protein L11 methyltransferase